MKKFQVAHKKKDLRIYEEFRNALVAISADKPLTIVLDNFRINTVSFEVFWHLWAQLFRHVGRELKNVNLVVALGDDAYQDYEVETELTLRSDLRTHRLVELKKGLSADEFKLLWKEYMYFRSDDRKKETGRTGRPCGHRVGREGGSYSHFGGETGDQNKPFCRAL